MNTTESGAAEYLRRYREILDTMIDEMTNAQLGCSISQNFIMQMIPHHRAAIEMSRNLLEHSRFRPVRCIAEYAVRAGVLLPGEELQPGAVRLSAALPGYHRDNVRADEGRLHYGLHSRGLHAGDDTSSPRRGSHVRERPAISAVQGASPDAGRYNLLADLQDTRDGAAPAENAVSRKARPPDHQTAYKNHRGFAKSRRSYYW